jgi:hypothetical protein
MPDLPVLDWMLTFAPGAIVTPSTIRLVDATARRGGSAA